MFQNHSEPTITASDYVRTPQNVRQPLSTFTNVSELLKTHNMLKNASQCPLELHNMTQNVRESFTITQNPWERFWTKQNTLVSQIPPQNLKEPFLNPWDSLWSPHNIRWHLWTVRSFSKLLRTHEITTECLRTPQKRQRISDTFRNLSEPWRTHQNSTQNTPRLVTERHRTFSNLSEPLRTHENVSEKLTIPRRMCEKH